MEITQPFIDTLVEQGYTLDEAASKVLPSFQHSQDITRGLNLEDLEQLLGTEIGTALPAILTLAPHIDLSCLFLSAKNSRMFNHNDLLRYLPTQMQRSKRERQVAARVLHSIFSHRSNGGLALGTYFDFLEAFSQDDTFVFNTAHSILEQDNPLALMTFYRRAQRHEPAKNLLQADKRDSVAIPTVRPIRHIRNHAATCPNLEAYSFETFDYGDPKYGNTIFIEMGGETVAMVKRSELITTIVGLRDVENRYGRALISGGVYGIDLGAAREIQQKAALDDFPVVRLDRLEVKPIRFLGAYQGNEMVLEWRAQLPATLERAHATYRK